MMLRDRLFHAQGEAAVGQQPSNSFNRVNVSTAKPTPAAQTPAPKAQIMVNNRKHETINIFSQIIFWLWMLKPFF